MLFRSPMFEESEELLERAFKEYQLFDLTKNYSFNNYINVSNGRVDKIEIGTKEKFLYPLKIEELTKVDYVYNIQDNIEAPVNKGDEVGEVKIFIDNNLQFSEKVYTMESVRRNSVWSKLKDFIDRW